MDHQLASILEPTFVLGTLGTVMILFTRIFTDYILKKKMIEKGYINEDAQSIFKKQEMVGNTLANLKWGLIIFFAGLALIVMEYIPYSPASPLPYGLFALFVSIGFLIYYFVAKQSNR